MKAWISSHRLNTNNPGVFRRRWESARDARGSSAALLLQSEDDPREMLSVSLWPDAEQFRRSREAAASPGRVDIFADLAHEQWGRAFDAWEAPATKGGGPGLLALAPASLAAAGAGAFLIRRRQQQRSAMEIVAKANGGWKRWLLLPAFAAPLGGGIFFLLRRLRGAPRPAESARSWNEPATAPPPAPKVYTYRPSAAGMRAEGDQSRLRVRDVMTPQPETIAHDGDLATAAAKMRDLDVGVLPVMAGGQVAGVITDRDLAMAMAGGDEQLSALRIEDLMSSVPVTVKPDATLQEATELMAGNQIRRLLVVDGTDLVGILSLGDLAVEGAEQHAESALEEISEPSEPRR